MTTSSLEYGSPCEKANPALVGDSQTVPVSFLTASDLALPWLPVPYLPVSTNVLADACLNCHVVYRDKEGGTAADPSNKAARCQP